jgi:ectoine hydroxylase-related dioxygenase (phytanoyl-CoA dioxygenase family)
VNDLVRSFQERGFVFPIRAFSHGTAAAYLAAYAEHERSGAIADDLPGFKHHSIFPWVHELCTNAAILDAVEALIGPNILLFGCRPWNKHAHDERFISWHQDSAYFGLDPHDEVTAWVAITDSTTENGCLRFIPGSHRWADQVHREAKDPMNRLSRGQTIESIVEEDAVDAELAAGEFSIHHERTVHGSKGNASGKRRLGFSCFFIPTHVTSTLGRRSALLVRGVDTYGHWDADPVPRFDLDPVGIEASSRASARYLTNATQSAERA